MRKYIQHFICMTLLLLMVSGCNEKSNSIEKKQDQIFTDEKEEISTKLVEDRRIYEYDNEESLIHLYVTILQSTNGEPYTFYDMNHWYDINSRNVDSPKLDVIVQEGSKKGPEKSGIRFEKGVANSTIEVRGNSNRIASQKSYKLKLLDSAGLWRGQKTINLNKHILDITRVRNKLTFDYLKLIPDMTSLRTQFVHLHIKDLTAKEPDKEFVDYGLFTQVEQVNERYLASRGLDSNGNLYKAVNFEFFRYPEQLKLATDPKYDKQVFNSILEIKGSEDHSKLLKMLDDVNNEELNINDVFNRYFDRDNYLTWVAVNILMGNTDTNSQNFYLYSPLHSEKWYFLSWDYDGAWGYYKDGPSRSKYNAPWQSGVGEYWGVVLHKRFFKDSKNVEALNEKVEFLSKIMKEQQTNQLLKEYYPIVKPFITNPPDLYHLPFKVEHFDTVFDKLSKIPERNKKDYYQKLENPMPIFLNDQKVGKGSYLFNWDYSFDLQGNELSYDFQISRDPKFSTIIKEKKNMLETKMTVHGLAPGQYFWRVIVKDSNNNQQVAFGNYENEFGDFFHGVRELIVR